jgi:hypothetical protein
VYEVRVAIVAIGHRCNWSPLLLPIGRRCYSTALLLVIALVSVVLVNLLFVTVAIRRRCCWSSLLVAPVVIGHRCYWSPLLSVTVAVGRNQGLRFQLAKLLRRRECMGGFGFTLEQRLWVYRNPFKFTPLHM